jgi:hypothetical protein
MFENIFDEMTKFEMKIILFKKIIFFFNQKLTNVIMTYDCGSLIVLCLCVSLCVGLPACLSVSIFIGFRRVLNPKREK